jgi:fucose permease
VLLMRATLASVVGGVAGPLVLSAAARSLGWNLGVLAPVPLAVALVVLARPGLDDPGPEPTASGGTARGQGRVVEPPLPRAYWLAWAFLALCVAAESSFVAWAAQVAVGRMGIELADATALGSLFVVGLVTGRVILGAGAGARAAPRRLLAGMAATAVAGGLMVWLGSWAVVTGLGLLVAGLGMAGVWATAAGVAVAAAPGSPVIAGARLNLATGGPMLVAPLLLGVVAGLAGVLVAWGAVIALLVAALVVLRLVPESPAGGPVESRASAGSVADTR